MVVLCSLSVGAWQNIGGCDCNLGGRDCNWYRAYKNFACAFRWVMVIIFKSVGINNSMALRYVKV